MDDQLLKDFRQLLEPYVKEKELLQNVTMGTKLSDDLHINSSNIVDIVLDAENKFDIIFEDKDFEKLHTVGDCIAIVEEKLSNK